MNDFLYNRRKQLGYTLEEVGKMVGVGKSTVRKWEQGMIENMGRDKIVSLSKALKISPITILGIDENDMPQNIIPIYEQLESSRQKKVYNYAEHELKEQNKVTNLKETQTVYLNSKLSAGTGILDLDPADTKEIEYSGYVPKHDLAFLVDGNSMEPTFQNGEVVFVERTPDIHSGQFIAVQINEEAFIKKAYIEDERLRLVSLNKEYEDIYADGHDDIRIVGRVIL